MKKAGLSRMAICVAVVVTLSVTSLFGQKMERGSTTKHISELINSDGTLKADLNFSGSINMQGYEAKTNAEGKPIFVPILKSDNKENTGEKLNTEWMPGDDYWRNDFGKDFGANGPVNVVTFNNNKLYIGGQFTKIGGITTNNYAVLDITTNTWTTTSFTGPNARVNDIIIDNAYGVIYVGGFFTTVNGQNNFKNIASFSQSAWWNMNGGPIGEINDLEIAYGGSFIIVGGEFSDIIENGQQYMSRGIAVFRTSTNKWFENISGVVQLNYTTGKVNVVKFFDNKIWVGGIFSYVLDSELPYDWKDANNIGIGYLNNNKLLWYNNSINIGVTSVSVTAEVKTIEYRDEYPNYTLFVGGKFSKAYDSQKSNFQVFNVAKLVYSNYIYSWSRLGSSSTKNGVEHTQANMAVVNSIVVNGPDIYVAGNFDKASDTLDFYDFVKWNGKWNKIVYSDIGEIKKLSFNNSNNDFYTAGSFETINGYSMNKIGIYNSNDYTWYSIGGNSVNGPIYAIKEYGNNVYFGGNFSTAGNVRAKNIVRYNKVSKTWTSLYNNVDGAVRTIGIINDNEIYAGGDNLTIDLNSPPRYITKVYKWNGANWSQFGDDLICSLTEFPAPFIPYVRDVLVVNSNEAYVGGRFANGHSIKKYDNGNWISLGGGLRNYIYMLGTTPGIVNKIVKNGNSLYVGGKFSRAYATELFNYISVKNLACWDLVNQTWSDIGGGIEGNSSRANSLYFDNNMLYVAGSFSTAGSQTGFNNIAKWNGSSWSQMGSGINGEVNALSYGGNRLFVGGDFTQANGSTANRIAYYVTSTNQWYSLGTGTNGSVFALNVKYSGGIQTHNSVWDLFLGGSFTSAGENIPSFNLGHWYYNQMQEEKAVSDDNQTENIPKNYGLNQNYPNPFNPSTTIKFAVPFPSSVKLVVYNTLGQEVKTLVNKYHEAGYFEINWDGTNNQLSKVPSGLYIYKMQASDFVQSKKMILVK